MKIVSNTALTVAFVFAAAAHAQSDPSGFPNVINMPEDTRFIGWGSTIGPDTQVNISPGGVVNNQVTAGDPANPNNNIEVNLLGGQISNQFRAEGVGTTVNVFSGNVGNRFTVVNNAVVNVYDGQFGVEFATGDGGVGNIYGGTFGDLFAAGFFGGVMNVYGGNFGQLYVGDGGTMNLFVTEASINGQPLDLVLGETVEITQRGSTSVLGVTLADGSFLDYTLNDDPSLFLDEGFDFLYPDFSGLIEGSTLTVTLIPAPGAAAALVGFALFGARRRR